MKFQKTKISWHLLAAFGALAAAGAQAQTTTPATPDNPPPETQQTQRVEITGSSIKRIAAESGLPVQTITREEIVRSGVQSTTELIQNLAVMQGYTAPSQSVNGLAAGVTTAAIHDLKPTYTLVLLNGRRLAPYNTGTTVNLNIIPLGAIERVEVLTDGASALYGADAVAGVVNFILRKDSTAGEFSANYTASQHGGGNNGTVSLTKGWGDLEHDRYNILVSGNFEHQQALNAWQRSFSKSGYVPFDYGGQHYITSLVSINAVAANVLLNSPGPNYPGDPYDINGNDSASPGGNGFNPYYAANGHCANNQKFIGGFCRFDYPSTVEDIAEDQRASIFVSGRLKVGETTSLFTELVFSRFTTDPRYAPPAQPLQINDYLYNKDIVPYLAANTGLTPSQVIPPSDPLNNGPQMTLRMYDAGGRQDRYQTDTIHAVLGADGTLGAWDYTTYYTHSLNKFSDKLEGGYFDKDYLYSILADGSGGSHVWDPLTATEGESVAILAPGVLHEVVDQNKSGIDVVNFNASRSLWRLDGGNTGLGVGGQYMRQTYEDTPAPILMGNNPLQPDYHNAIVGGGGGAMPSDARRNSFGFFGELQLPFTRQLEVTASARYDDISAVKNEDGFDNQKNPIGSVTQGKDQSDVTWKLTGRLQPVKEFLLRGSIGTGFRAPTMADIAAPLQSAGSTGTQGCPPGLLPELTALCKDPAGYEYNTATVGTPGTGDDALKPEHSKQWTLGFRIEPSDKFSFGADLWDVRVHDTIGYIPEDSAFENEDGHFSYLFASVPDPISGAPALTFIQKPQNLGTSHYQGIDFDASGHMATSIGRLTGAFNGTYMLVADYQFFPGDQMHSSLDRLGDDSQVTFRWQLGVSVSLESGPWTNTVNAFFKPGYWDRPGTVRTYDPATGAIGGAVDTSDWKIRVGNYQTFDWQGRYDFNKAMSLTVGVKNIFDHKPPFTAQDEVPTGNARGYDGRYTDPVGRALYLAGSYKF
jgi:iron complex outermembrane receptor protein